MPCGSHDPYGAYTCCIEARWRGPARRPRAGVIVSFFRLRSNAGRPCIVAAACAAALALASARGQPGDAAGITCEGTNVSVRGAEGAEAASACTAIAAAIGFLASSGMDTRAPVEVRFVSGIPPVLAGTRSFGCHVKAERRIYVLTLGQCLEQTSNLPVDEDVHRGLVAHEVGHHVASANFRVAKPTVVAHEYIAYVTMFATMPPAARERVLRLFPGEGFLSEQEMGLTIYLLDPHRFGAQAYRHFLRAENGPAFFERIVSGQALAVEDAP
ncbi:MAG: DUF6639 family protein [Burkholderiaceae bacterium]